MKYRSTQATVYPPDGWMKKPAEDSKNSDIKLMIWKARFYNWLLYINNQS